VVIFGQRDVLFYDIQGIVRCSPLIIHQIVLTPIIGTHCNTPFREAKHANVLPGMGYLRKTTSSIGINLYNTLDNLLIYYFIFCIPAYNAA
jgi:hypothetical protein